MTKVFTLTTLLAALGSMSFANTTELFTDTFPKTLDSRLGKAKDIYSREDFPIDKDISPCFLSGSLLVLTPTAPLLPENTYSPGFRIEGGLNTEIWDLGLTYTYFGISAKYDSDWVLDNNPNKRIKIDSRYSLNDYEGTLAIPYALPNDLLVHTLFGLEYAKTETTAKYFYKKQAMSDRHAYRTFSGMGPLLGVKFQKTLPKGFSVVGSLIQSILPSRLTWGKDKIRKFSPVTKARIAGEWSVGDERSKYFRISAGYEGQYWFNESAIIEDKYAEVSNLGLQGFQIQAKLDF